MLNKKFQHKRIEECPLCKKEIHTSDEFWVALCDLDKNKLKDVKFYHQSCMNDLLKGKGEVIAKNFEERLKSFTSRVLGNVGTIKV